MSQVELRPQKGAQEIAMNSKADVVIYGGAAGSGKSHMMLLRALLQVDDPDFGGIIFRRTGKQLTGAGGLWPEAKKMYNPWMPRITEQNRKMYFKDDNGVDSGATLEFSHMEHDKNAMMDHQGLQYSLVIFDEATHFSEYQVTYLMSRLRSAADGDSQMFLSCNPDPDSFLATWIDWWLDEEGYPDKAKSGVVRYYATVEGVLKHAATAEEIKAQFPEAFKIYNPVDDTTVHIEPKTITFIGGTIFDNPALIRANPKYLAELNSLPPIEKARLLHGNWKVRPEGSSYYDRRWLRKAIRVPKGVIQCRAWDKAATEKSEVNTHPDYTASCKMSKCPDGDFYITGDYHPENYDDEDKEVLGRFRKTPGKRDKLIQKQSEYDGTDCVVVFSKDPGQSGITEFQESAKKLIPLGFRVKEDPMPTQNSKLVRYTPFSSACENGMVYIVESTFTKASLEHFHKENESFDGERSSRVRKDDIPDSCASAFNYLCTARVVNLVCRNQTNTATLAIKVLSGLDSVGVKVADLEEMNMSPSEMLL